MCGHKMFLSTYIVHLSSAHTLTYSRIFVLVPSLLFPASKIGLAYRMLTIRMQRWFWFGILLLSKARRRFCTHKTRPTRLIDMISCYFRHLVAQNKPTKRDWKPLWMHKTFSLFLECVWISCTTHAKPEVQSYLSGLPTLTSLICICLACMRIWSFLSNRLVNTMRDVSNMWKCRIYHPEHIWDLLAYYFIADLIATSLT